jgi:hypothetical protein
MLKACLAMRPITKRLFLGYSTATKGNFALLNGYFLTAGGDNLNGCAFNVQWTVVYDFDDNFFCHKNTSFITITIV